MGGATKRSLISAYFLLSAYFLTAQSYKRMRLNNPSLRYLIRGRYPGISQIGWTVAYI